MEPGGAGPPMGLATVMVLVGEGPGMDMPGSIFWTITVLLPPPGVAMVNCCSLWAPSGRLVWGLSLPGVWRSFNWSGFRICRPGGLLPCFSLSSASAVNAFISFSNKSQTPGSFASSTPGSWMVAAAVVVGVLEGVEGVLLPMPLSMLGALYAGERSWAPAIIGTCGRGGICGWPTMGGRECRWGGGWLEKEAFGNC